MLLLPAARDKLGLLLTLYCQAGTSQPHSSPGNSLLPQQGMGFSRQGFFSSFIRCCKATDEGFLLPPTGESQVFTAECPETGHGKPNMHQF